MEDVIVVWTMFINIRGKVCVYRTHLTLVTFMARDIISFNGIFSMFSLARLIKLMVYLKICQQILKQLFHMTENMYSLL